MITPNFEWHQGADQLSLAEHLAGEIVLQINQAIEAKGQAIVVFSGGSTPKPLFEALASDEIDWARVVVTLVDERWVDHNHTLSNSAFLQTYLLDLIDGPKPEFVTLYQSAETVEESCSLVLESYKKLTNSSGSAMQAFDVVVLGMGSDGHTASFFPDAANINELVDPNSTDALLTCSSPTTQVPRITWSVPCLLNTSFLALHITGETKADVFQRACVNHNAFELPIRCAIFQDTTKLQVFYAD